ncbi:hypothetical protein H6F44_09725 [Pseudanabaena sp. FACHB-1277]|uniref:Uncharacterized protein n=1 Tax=Pseudanabaena cinerea FACHB-1277 TaxID=2949581 RepID=A0A926Z7V7_9CYAN|nr:hypothetical protein [Pseudanabaena cinerea]MBD2150394.1 hypothetical protein [Pseudanabaena cinerea FACHB-1277]
MTTVNLQNNKFRQLALHISPNHLANPLADWIRINDAKVRSPFTFNH